MGISGTDIGKEAETIIFEPLDEPLPAEIPSPPVPERQPVPA